MTAKFKSGASIPLGSVFQFDGKVGVSTTVDDMHFVRAGSYVTSGYDPSLDDLAKNTRGRTWQASNTLLGPALGFSETTSIFSCMTPSGAILAWLASGTNIWRSTDLGATWSIVYTHGASASFGPKALITPTGRVIFNPNNVANIIVSDDDGLTWATRSLAQHYDPAYPYLVCPNTGTIIYTSAGGVVARSINNGDTFSDANVSATTTGSTANAFNDIASVGNGVWIGAKSDMYFLKSVDDGATWTQQILSSIGFSTTADFLSVAALGDEVIVSLSSSGRGDAYVSTDGGINFTPVPNFFSTTIAPATSTQVFIRSLPGIGFIITPYLLDPRIQLIPSLRAALSTSPPPAIISSLKMARVYVYSGPDYLMYSTNMVAEGGSLGGGKGQFNLSPKAVGLDFAGSFNDFMRYL